MGLRDDATQATGQVEQRPLTAVEQMRRMVPEFEAALPRRGSVEATQLVRDLMTCMRRVKYLDQCEPFSVLGAMMTGAQLGLRPGVLGHWWPVPFRNGKTGRYEATFVIGYQGLIELAYRSGLVTAINVDIAYENDPVFDVQLGTDRAILHRPLLNGDRGAPIAYYATARIKGGTDPVFDFMSLDAVLAHRGRYAKKTSNGAFIGPWGNPPGTNEFDGMALKTVVKRGMRTLPKSVETATAIEADGGVRVDVTPHADPVEATVRIDDGDPADEYDPTTEEGFGDQS